MTIYDELKRYANDCIHDALVCGVKHKWAAARFLRDCKRAEEDPACFFHWDEKQAQEIVLWFSYLYHSKGILAGKPIELTTWQRFRLCQLYGWRRNDTGAKRFTKMFCEVGRKNAKSQEEGAIALKEISVEAVRRGEVVEAYTAGVKRDQSKIVPNEAALMLRGSPLEPKFKITNTKITHIKSGSYIQALSRDDGKNGDGSNPGLLVLDEYHLHSDTGFYDLGLGSNTKESLMVIITTAGMDLTKPCYTQEYKYCSDILNPAVDVDNDEYLIDINELDPDDYKDPIHIPERSWIKANPIRATYKEGMDKLRKEYEIACQIPEKMTSWLTKMGDVWVQAKSNGYMDMGKWKACEVQALPIDTHKKTVIIGLDLSKKTDLTSVAFCVPFIDTDGLPSYCIEHHSFIPTREKLTEHVAVDHFDYITAERLGLVTVTDTPIVDQQAVLDYCINRCTKMEWSIECFAFDPAGGSKSMMDMSAAGYDVEEVYQSHKSLHEATNGLREAVYNKRIYYTADPLLNFAMANATIRVSNGLIKIDKDASHQRIDPVDALICAFKLAMYHDFESAGLFTEQIDDFLNEDW